MGTGIPFDLPRVFDGGVIEDAFHGTSAERARAIVSGGFRLGTQPDRYGAGTYFFEGDYQAACWWARDHEKVPQPVVVRAKVALGKTLYLNFIMEALDELRAALATRLNIEKLELKQAYAVFQAQLVRDKAVQSFKVVRAAKGKRTYCRGQSSRAEIVIVVFGGAAQITVQETLTPGELEQKVSLGL